MERESNVQVVPEQNPRAVSLVSATSTAPDAEQSAAMGASRRASTVASRARREFSEGGRIPDRRELRRLRKQQKIQRLQEELRDIP